MNLQPVQVKADILVGERILYYTIAFGNIKFRKYFHEIMRMDDALQQKFIFALHSFKFTLNECTQWLIIKVFHVA